MPEANIPPQNIFSFKNKCDNCDSDRISYSYESNSHGEFSYSWKCKDCGNMDHLVRGYKYPHTESMQLPKDPLVDVVGRLAMIEERLRYLEKYTRM